MHFPRLAIAFLVLVLACGDAPEAAPGVDTSAATVSTGVAATQGGTVDAGDATTGDTTTVSSTVSTTVSTAETGADLAPDFTLDLGDGGTFVLSETAKPVYLVFWAEW